MKTFTETPLRTVIALELNRQRAVILKTDVGQVLCGDVLRFVTDAPDVHDRIDCFRAVSHVLELGDARLVSLRPLASFELAALKK